MEIRPIEPHDAEVLRNLRIRAVKEYPSAFAASVEEESAVTIEETAKQLTDGCSYFFWRGCSITLNLLAFFMFFDINAQK